MTDIPVEEGRAVHLVSRPEGPLQREHLALVDLPTPRLTPGHVLVRNLCVAIDPQPAAAATRQWPLHTAVPAGSLVGEVIASRSADLPPGTLVTHEDGWATHSVLPRGGHLTRVLEPAPGVPVSAYLSVLGLPGLAAHVGLTRILDFQPGETLFVAGAADPAGAAAGQIARLLGATRVLGGVDSSQAARVAAQDPAFDAVFEHGPGRDRLDAALIGTEGPYLADALKLVRDFGRIAWMHGSPHDSAEPVAPEELSAVHGRSIRVEGFGVRHHLHLLKQVEARYAGDVAAGRLRPGRTVEIDFAALVDALVDTARAGFRGTDVYRLTA